VASVATIFIGGLIAWTFVEYVIHAWLGHRFNTFVKPIHDVHHRYPNAVFTIGAWIPLGLIWLGGLILFGITPAIMFYSALMAGFILYEAMHYRVHFSTPSCLIEVKLRARHLIHHYNDSNRCFGVTSPLWDIAFGTELMGARMRQNLAAVAATPPLKGRTNLRRLIYFWTPGNR
jgi:sterol desaturase/sphingolipid hydroxylase (fatty acid hydroxylase superfamily)